MPSAVLFTGTRIAFIPIALNSRTSACSVVVPAMTAIRFPLRSVNWVSFDFASTSALPPSTKIGRLKATVFSRDSVIVVVPHSASALPLATSSSRVAASAGTHSTLSSLMPRSFWIAPAMRVQSSTL